MPLITPLAARKFGGRAGRNVFQVLQVRYFRGQATESLQPADVG